MADSSTQQQRQQVVARYEQLLEALGEDPFRATSALSQAEEAARAMDAASTTEERARVLAAAARSSLRCAELIEQALEATARLGRVQKKVSAAIKAHERNEEDEEEDEDDEMDGSDDDDDDDSKAALLLEDLIAVGGELQDASKKYAQLGVASKTAHTSRALLSAADQSLEEAMLASADSTGWGAADSSRVRDEFRALYMDEFTAAFGDDLDAFRQEERFESKDVTYLISCIHAGGDIFSPLQKKLFVSAADSAKAAE
ncbi:hypothetical protein PybrP1_003987 [[Pythium] brassicae (nom. inval.)]|nr:hypothetical protein PybrP1_003987 [[Pythium] brassicae (nom. inval.)]